MLASDQNLLLRADAGPATGMKHVYRCVRLATAWQKLGGTATLACGDLPRRLERQLSAKRIRTWTLAYPDRAQQDARQTREIARAVNPNWLVLDGPRFDSSYCAHVLDQSWKLATMARVSHGSDQAKGSNDEVIRLAGERLKIPATSCFADESNSELPAAAGEARKLLVWLSENASGSMIAETVQNVIDVTKKRTSIDVVIRPSQVNDAELLAVKKSNSHLSLRFWRSADRRLSSMAPIQLAIVDTDEIAQSVACRGVPVAQITDWGTAKDAADAVTAGAVGLASLRSHPSMFQRELSKLIRDRGHRHALAVAGRAANDSQAAHRVARRLAVAGLSLQSAVAKDWPAVRRWVREAGSQSPVSSKIDFGPTMHGANVLQSLDRSSSQCWMLRRPTGVPVGAACVQRVEGLVHERRLEIMIDPAFRNQGYGTALLEQMIERAAADNDCQRVVIQFVPGNQAAERMAHNAGLKPAPPAATQGKVACQFELGLERATAAERQPLKRSA